MTFGRLELTESGTPPSADPFAHALVLGGGRDWLMGGTAELKTPAIDATDAPLNVFTALDSRGDPYLTEIEAGAFRGELRLEADARLRLETTLIQDAILVGAAGEELALGSNSGFGPSSPLRLHNVDLQTAVYASSPVIAEGSLTIDGSLEIAGSSHFFGPPVGLSLQGMDQIAGHGELVLRGSSRWSPFPSGMELTSDSGRVVIGENLTFAAETNVNGPGLALINEGQASSRVGDAWTLDRLVNRGRWTVLNPFWSSRSSFRVTGDVSLETAGLLNMAHAVISGELVLPDVPSEPSALQTVWRLIVATGELTGTFDTVATESHRADALRWAVTYENQAVMARLALPGDANLNGQIEQADLDAVLGN